jgi:hypothetical protein
MGIDLENGVCPYTHSYAHANRRAYVDHRASAPRAHTHSYAHANWRAYADHRASAPRAHNLWDHTPCPGGPRGLVVCQVATLTPPRWVRHGIQRLMRFYYSTSWFIGALSVSGDKNT